MSLKLHDQQALQQFLADVPNPASSQVSGNRQSITFTGTASRLKSTFHIGLGNYLDEATGRRFFANDSAPALPKSVSTVVESVVGLDNHAVKHHAGRTKGEVDLDVEVVHALAAAADSYVYEAENSSAGELAMYQQIASDKKVSVVSISGGSCEASEHSSAAHAVDKAIASGTAEGISHFAAAGDDGATDCGRQDGSKRQAVDFPSSDPDVSGDAAKGSAYTVVSGGRTENA
ncbi:protease pro-enzyme activation domain-containing protein [Amycolatopsis panacis]|uniref:protease pro-enzyme activation domain-containing protein n=1 Tax=Amycolatopsis panacis TaxID=2340917 RepID=UPI001EEF7045|nr:protease pro-enzyme activation domain-containing protein [Amycolatopsis panacis]